MEKTGNQCQELTVGTSLHASRSLSTCRKELVNNFLKTYPVICLEPRLYSSQRPALTVLKQVTIFTNGATKSYDKSLVISSKLKHIMVRLLVRGILYLVSPQKKRGSFPISRAIMIQTSLASYSHHSTLTFREIVSGGSEPSDNS